MRRHLAGHTQAVPSFFPLQGGSHSLRTKNLQFRETEAPNQPRASLCLGLLSWPFLQAGWVITQI